MQSVIDIGPIKLIVTGSCGSGQIASVHMADLIPVKFKLNFSTVDAQPLLNGIPFLAGEVILSGSLVPLESVVAGDKREMELEGVGRCSVNFV